MKTILVVEDESRLLDLLRTMLEEAGYCVVGAKDGAEARDLYRRQQGQIDLVLCDMALPKFGGWTVYLMLKEINPHVKVILTSGYLDPKVRTQLVEGGVKDFIPKPYDPESFLRRVGEAMNAA
jgi:two-component system cell cycle sensor histidine kinase/response regulator CckA